MRSIEWAAGLFEGEGCIYLTPKEEVHLHLASTDYDVLAAFHEAVGGRGAIYNARTSSAGSKQMWQWSSGRKVHCQWILEAFLPFLLERRKQKALSVLPHCAYKRKVKSRIDGATL